MKFLRDVMYLARSRNYFRRGEDREALPVTAAYENGGDRPAVWHFADEDAAVAHLIEHCTGAYAMARDGAVRRFDYSAAPLSRRRGD